MTNYIKISSSAVTSRFKNVIKYDDLTTDPNTLEKEVYIEGNFTTIS